MKSLAEALDAQIVARPLLVEALLATRRDGTSSEAQWHILVDSERFKVTTQCIENESSLAPLTSRLRTTLAHELLHILDFQNWRQPPKKALKPGASKREFIGKIERETEGLTSLLLIGEESLARLAEKETLCLRNIVEFRRGCAVSREILVNRLRLLPIGHYLRFNSSLENVGLGIVTRQENGSWQIDPWPLFSNFQNNRAPRFAVDAKGTRPVPISSLVPDPDFVLNGGRELVVEIDGHRGREEFDYLKMRVRLEVEWILGDTLSKALLLIQRIDG